MKFLSEFIKRLGLPTPEFFAKVRTIGLAISAIGLGLQGFNIAGSKLLPLLQGIAPDIIVVGGVIALIAQSAAKPETPNKNL